MMTTEQVVTIATLIAVAASTFYNEWQRRVTAKAVTEVAAVGLQKMEEIRRQGNSVLGEHLHTVALLTDRIAMTTKESGDLKRSEEALAAYQKHVADQAQLAKDKQALDLAIASGGPKAIVDAAILLAPKPVIATPTTKTA